MGLFLFDDLKRALRPCHSGSSALHDSCQDHRIVQASHCVSRTRFRSSVQQRDCFASHSFPRHHRKLEPLNSFSLDLPQHQAIRAPLCNRRIDQNHHTWLGRIRPIFRKENRLWDFSAQLSDPESLCLGRGRTGHSRPFLDNTEKLELPSISQVSTRGPVDISWYNHHAAQRPLLSSDRLPNLQLPQTYPASVSSGTSSSRIGSLDSSSNYSSNQYPPSLTSASSYPSSGNPPIGLKTPSPSPASQVASSHPHVQGEDSTAPAQYSSHSHHLQAYGQEAESYSSAMNPNQQYLDSQHSHMSGGPSYAPQSQTSGGMAHYPQYQQAPALQPVHGSYAPTTSYTQYGYPTGVTSPQSTGQPVSAPQMNNTQLLPLPSREFLYIYNTGIPTNMLPAMPVANHTQHGYGAHGNPAQAYPPQTYDTTGQNAPPGMKPRVTATLWEDEGSLCFQVEAKGVCVARREGMNPRVHLCTCTTSHHALIHVTTASPQLTEPTDNHMINGTKLLNVAGMTRGRRDGILKSEKLRHVVKIGPMHLKGVWYEDSFSHFCA